MKIVTEKSPPFLRATVRNKPGRFLLPTWRFANRMQCQKPTGIFISLPLGCTITTFATLSTHAVDNPVNSLLIEMLKATDKKALQQIGHFLANKINRYKSYRYSDIAIIGQIRPQVGILGKFHILGFFEKWRISHKIVWIRSTERVEATLGRDRP